MHYMELSKKDGQASGFVVVGTDVRERDLILKEPNINDFP